MEVEETDVLTYTYIETHTSSHSLSSLSYYTPQLHTHTHTRRPTHQIILILVDEGRHELCRRVDTRGTAEVNAVRSEEVADVVGEGLCMCVCVCVCMCGRMGRKGEK